MGQQKWYVEGRLTGLARLYWHSNSQKWVSTGNSNSQAASGVFLVRYRRCARKSVTSRRCVKEIRTSFTKISHTASTSLLMHRRTSRRATNVRFSATGVLLALHGKWRIRYFTELPVMCIKPSYTIRKLKPHLFPPTGLLQSVRIDIVGFLPKTKSGNQFIVVMTEMLLKLTKIVPSTKRQQIQLQLSSSVPAWRKFE